MNENLKQSAPLMELRGITKRFPGVTALSDVSLSIHTGEVLALVGENGAGKSTLIKVMTGFHQMDEGEILIDGTAVTFTHPNQAIDAGIACIYQELSIVPDIDVAKNLFLGNWPKKGVFLDNRTMYRKAKEILSRIHLDVDPHVKASNLSIAQQQMLEIGRALTRDARIIIMDEPTSSLTDREADILLELVMQLKREGVAIIYISHKLDEVMQVSDRATILCDGKNVTTVETKDVTRDKLIEYMLGRPMDDMYGKQEAELGEVLLSVAHLTRKGVFTDVSFEARRGEVLGFFGLVGAGRSEIMRAIFGVDAYDSGTISIDGKPVTISNPVQARRHGLALVPEDRKKEGLALRLSILNNMTMVKISEINHLGFIDKKTQRSLADQYVKEIRVKTPSVNQLAGNLSGGNQQKVVIAKWLMENPDILILDEPTRGIDVGSKAEIYEIIYEIAKKGASVIVVSSDLTEILGICDRVITVAEGKITAEFSGKTATDKEILAAALGGVPV